MEGAEQHATTTGISVIQPHISVTNIGVMQSSLQGKRVLVTPLRAHQKTVQCPIQVRNQTQEKQGREIIQKVLLKAFTRNRKNVYYSKYRHCYYQILSKHN